MVIARSSIRSVSVAGRPTSGPGLTPAQDNSIYGAPPASPRTTGKDATMGVFELSDYQHSDIDTWARTFFGPHFTPPLTDVKVVPLVEKPVEVWSV